MTHRKKARRLAAGAACVALLSAGAALFAQAPSAGKVKAPAQRRDAYVNLDHADRGTRKLTPAGPISSLSGDVVLTYEDTTLRTDAASFNEKTQVATSPGKVQIDDAQNTIVGDKGVVYYPQRRAVLTGNVRITARPRPQDRSAAEGSLRREFKDTVTITCDRVEYNWRTRVATGTGNLTLRQKDRTVTADRGVYEGRAERVTLTGNLRGVTTAGDEIRAESAVVVLREGEESLELINPKGRFLVPEETEEAGQPPAPSAPALPAAPLTPAPAPGARP